MVTMSQSAYAGEEASDAQLDVSTYHLGSSQIALRADLIFSPASHLGEGFYSIEDPASGDFHFVGTSEYMLLSLLDGRRTLDEALAAAASASDGNSANRVAVGAIESLTPEEAMGLVGWAIKAGLANTAYSHSPERSLQKRERIAKSKLFGLLNPIMFRISLGCPDRIVNAIYRRVRLLLESPAIFIAMGLLVLAAAMCLAENWFRFHHAIQNVIAPSNWIYLIMATAGLRLVHELGHALMCKRFGGQVRDCGVMFLLLMPLPYVDVTSAWRFESKWPRILTSAAGMMVEVLLASMAVLVWSRTASGVLNQQAYNIIIMASVVTLLFNINPLMKFDGYYMLSDLTSTANLASRGASYLRGLLLHAFFGMRPRRLAWSWREVLVRVYGFLAAAWRMMITASLLLAAANFIPGVGLVIAGLSLFFMLAIPAVRIVQRLFLDPQTSAAGRLRFFSVTALLSLTICSVATFIPAPATITAPMVVDHDPRGVVRAEASGFVTHVLVKPLQNVNAGQPLIRLANEQLGAEVHQLKDEVLQWELKSRTALNAGDLTLFQTADKRRAAIQERLDRLQDRQNKLVVRASVSGRVLTSDLKNLHGSFVRRGDRVLSIGRLNAKKGLALLEPSVARTLAPDQLVKIKTYGDWASTKFGTLKTIAPQATTRLPNRAFSASGPIGVAVIPSTKEGDDTYVLAQPVVVAEIQLSERLAETLLAGQPAQIRVAGGSQTMGDFVAERISRWITHRLKSNHGI